MNERRRGFLAAPAEKEKMRTHLMMFSAQSEKSPRKRTKRKHNKLQKMLHAQHVDTAVQTSTTDLDPAEWTGNQRVAHYGPMAQRDPFFYYYPKGWDVLYPAHFGFFPYRTSKFRGSSPTICLTAFGFFLLVSGICMCLIGFVFGGHTNYVWNIVNENDSLSTVPPIQLAGPIFIFLGVSCLVLGGFWWFCSLNLFSEHLRHSQPHRAPPKRTLHIPARPPPSRDWSKSRDRLSKSPYQPAPPYPVIINAHTNVSCYSPEAEMKLFPPIMPGYSTISLPRSYIGSPYNTLNADEVIVPRRQSFLPAITNPKAAPSSRATMPRGSMHVPHTAHTDESDEGEFHWMQYHAANM